MYLNTSIDIFLWAGAKLHLESVMLPTKIIMNIFTAIETQDRKQSSLVQRDVNDLTTKSSQNIFVL